MMKIRVERETRREREWRGIGDRGDWTSKRDGDDDDDERGPVARERSVIRASVCRRTRRLYLYVCVARECTQDEYIREPLSLSRNDHAGESRSRSASSLLHHHHLLLLVFFFVSRITIYV